MKNTKYFIGAAMACLMMTGVASTASAHDHAGMHNGDRQVHQDRQAHFKEMKAQRDQWHAKQKARRIEVQNKILSKLSPEEQVQAKALFAEAEALANKHRQELENLQKRHQAERQVLKGKIKNLRATIKNKRKAEKKRPSDS